MNKKIYIIIGISIVIIGISIVIVSLIGFIITHSLPCSYINFAWGAVKKECECLGLEIDTSCKSPSGEPCPDAGGSTGCIGIVKEYRCYEFIRFSEKPNYEAEWTQVPCNK